MPSGAYLMLESRGPCRAGGHKMPLGSDRWLSKAPAMCSNTTLGPHESYVYLKSLSVGKASTHQMRKIKSTHIGLVVHFRAALGLSGSNKMLSVLLHRRDQDGSVEGGATHLGTIVYRAKGNANPSLTQCT